MEHLVQFVLELLQLPVLVAHLRGHPDPLLLELLQLNLSLFNILRLIHINLIEPVLYERYHLAQELAGASLTLNFVLRTNNNLLQYLLERVHFLL